MLYFLVFWMVYDTLERGLKGIFRLSCVLVVVWMFRFCREVGGRARE